MMAVTLLLEIPPQYLLTLESGCNRTQAGLVTCLYSRNWEVQDKKLKSPVFEHQGNSDTPFCHSLHLVTQYYILICHQLMSFLLHVTFNLNVGFSPNWSTPDPISFLDSSGPAPSFLPLGFSSWRIGPGPPWVALLHLFAVCKHINTWPAGEAWHEWLKL